MQVGILGDVHGNRQWIVNYALSMFHARGIDTIIQVGDLGVGDGPLNEVWDGVNKRLRGNGQTMFVAPGNHEDYDLIDRLECREDGWLVLRERILLAPRGLRTTMGDRSVLWVGGAGSVNRQELRQAGEWRGLHKRWWAGEALTEADVTTASAGGTVDIIVSHDAPTNVRDIDRHIINNGRFRQHDIAYANECRERFTRVVEAVTPDLILHGHYHRRVDDIWHHPDTQHTTRVCGFACEFMDAALGMLDTETMTVEWWPLNRT